MKNDRMQSSSSAFDSFYNKKPARLTLEVSGKIFISSGGKPSGILKRNGRFQLRWISAAVLLRAEFRACVPRCAGGPAVSRVLEVVPWVRMDGSGLSLQSRTRRADLRAAVILPEINVGTMDSHGRGDGEHRA